MRIFCKERDYYDYLQIHDDDIIFDRRNYCVWSNNEIISHFPTYEKNILRPNDGTRYQILALRAGYKLFFFKLTIFDISNNDMRGDLLNTLDFKYNIEFIGSRFDYTYKDDPLTFVGYEANIGHDRKYNTVVADVLKDNLNNIKCYSLKYDWWHHRDGEYCVPLISNTFVAKYISGEEIYNAIDDYLRSKKNDVDQESSGITDVDKAINHGFDKRTSFRNVK